MHKQGVDPRDWAGELAAFLRAQPEVSAVRIDPAAHKVEIATLGTVDLAALQLRLAATIAAVEQQLGTKTQAKATAGFTLRQAGGSMEVGRETCVTAERFWHWREVEWPALIREENEEESEWRELALFAGICGGCGLGGYAAGALLPDQLWISRLIYFIGVTAGGWDAAKDSWANLRTLKLDIHFLMVAVAIGAMAIGAWGEAVLLLFLFSASGAMEAYALDRTNHEVNALLKSSPKRAIRLREDGSEEEVDVAELQVGPL